MIQGFFRHQSTTYAASKTEHLNHVRFLSRVNFLQYEETCFRQNGSGGDSFLDQTMHAMTDIAKNTPATGPLIRNISDTALWVQCIARGRVSVRMQYFRDPLAKRLAGERGEQIAVAWSSAKRTPGRLWRARIVLTASSASRLRKAPRW